MYRDKSKVLISVYMLCYSRMKFISISSVIFMYRTVFVLCTLLFAVVMDVVSSEARCGLPPEWLYAYDLVHIAPTMVIVK